MKSIRILAAAVLITGALSIPRAAHADDKDKKTDKPKPYTLKTCPVSDEKLGGDMGKPYVYIYKDREIKFCCKDCRKDFDKDPAKYIKKIEEAEAKAKK